MPSAGAGVMGGEGGTGTSLLIVDDDRETPELLGELLDADGYRVQVAHDGETALRLMRTRLPDALLLDVEMPQLSGPDVAYRTLVLDAGMEAVPIILVSGVVDLDLVAKRVGTPYFLAKPYELDQLLILLRYVLHERLPPSPSFE